MKICKVASNWSMARKKWRIGGECSILTEDCISKKQSRYRPRGGPRGFQEVKVPRFRDNGTGWW